MLGNDNGYQLLIVDDDDAHRMLEKEILEDAGHTVHQARNAEEAIAAIAATEFDVVLLDKRMPGMDGDQLAAYIRHELNQPLLPIIMVTGTTMNDELVKSLSAGANDFVRKPYNSTELLARVNAAAAHKRLTDQLDSAESMLFALARMVEAKDENTGDHCSRLQHTANVFAELLGLNEEEKLALRRGGVMHDIGKLGIPDSILLKQGPLDDDEWIIMRQHTVIGERLCSGLKSMRLTLPIIRHHHERWDGTGYPDGLKGEEIPFLARVFQVLDIYDALISKRPYKESMAVADALRIMEEEMTRGWRDPALMQQFIELVRSRPEALRMPDQARLDDGARIFEDIMATGVLDWDKRRSN